MTSQSLAANIVICASEMALARNATANQRFTGRSMPRYSYRKPLRSQMGWAPVILIFPRMYALKARIYLSLGQRPKRRYATISSAEGATHVSPMLASGYADCDHP